MTVADVSAPPVTGDMAAELKSLVAELYPICRSITGDGVRQTLRLLSNRLPLEVHEVPSGTGVFDWTVPQEWNIRDAWVKDLRGNRVIDFRRSNLHVVNYSTPIHRRVSRAELLQHVHTLAEHPDWIPYTTSYYAETWGFSATARQAEALTDAEYDVCIDSTLEAGHLTYGEYLLQGAQQDEILLSCHICHPSLCNDNLSGIAVAVALGRWLASLPVRRFSYRLLFIPGTIGAITWLSQNASRLQNIRHGLVLTGLGGPGPLVYKRSRRGNATIDRAVPAALGGGTEPFEMRDFSPYGYDERQYCSPGINLPVGRLSRTPFGEYPEYHTSADNLEFVTGEQLQGSFTACQRILTALEQNRTYMNMRPMCEPQLGRRGLYPATGGAGERRLKELAILWVLNLSDGSNSLLDICERAGLPFETIRDAASRLAETDLLREIAVASGEQSGAREWSGGS